VTFGVADISGSQEIHVQWLAGTVVAAKVKQTSKNEKQKIGRSSFSVLTEGKRWG